MTFVSPIFCATCGAANEKQAQACFACGQALIVPETEDEAGAQTVIRQRYRILSQIGQGGMGAVYKAEDIELADRPVAIKEMSLRGLNKQEADEATRAFRHEAHLLAGLVHPNLPRIYDHFSEAGRWYLVMDFIEGETLESYLAKLPEQKLSLKDVLEIAIQLCTVLDYLHTRQPQIVFRDLKPSNVMRTPAGHLYLIDFGIARHFKPGQVKDTAALGSPGYAAPEQYGKAQTTPAADIYSLGAIIHQLVMGHDPAETPFHFPPLEATAPARLQTLLNQMLAMDVVQRPQRVMDVKRELQQLVAQELSSSMAPLQTPAAPAVPPSTNTGWASHRVRRQTPQTPRSSAVRVSSSMQPSIGQHFFTNQSHGLGITAVAWSPEGKRIASASYDRTIQIWDVARRVSQLVYKDHAWLWKTSHVNALSWSPDGLWLASASADHTVHVWNTITGKNKYIYRDHIDPVTAVAWSPDGELLATAAGHLFNIWDPLTGNTILSENEHTDVISQLAWSSDGTYLASASLDKTVNVYDATKWDVGTGVQARYYHRYGHIYSISWSPDGTFIASAGADGTVQVWEALTGKHLLTYRGHQHSVLTVAWSPDGTRIASGGLDGVVHIWEALTGAQVFVYPGHKWDSSISTLSWSPDGSAIASGGTDATVQVWQAR